MTEPFRKEFAWSSRYRFADWPNASVPNVAAGVYLIWEEARLIYVGMSGRKIGAGREQHRSRAGLVTRLASHASGRLSGDQFCVYVANRIVIPRLTPDQLPRFEAGDLRLSAAKIEQLDAMVANGSVGLKLFLSTPDSLSPVSELIEGCTGGNDRVHIVIELDEDREAEVVLEKRYRLTGPVRAAIKSVPGVEAVDF